MTQRAILIKSGIPADEIERFTEPEHWLEYFPPLGKVRGGRARRARRARRLAARRVPCDLCARPPSPRPRRSAT